MLFPLRFGIITNVAALTPGASGYTFVNAEAETYVNAMSSTPDDTRKEIIDDFFGSIKADIGLAKFDGLYLIAAHDAQAARLNAVDPGTFDLGTVNSPTFTADTGYIGDGSTSYLTTGFTPSTAGGVYAQDDSHTSVWSLTDTTNSNHVDIGARTNSTTLHTMMQARSQASQAVIAMNQGALQTYNHGGTSVGHFVHTRTTSTAKDAYRNATGISIASQASTGLPAFAFFIGALNQNGSALGYSARRYAAASFGSSLTSGEVTSYYNHLTTYLTAVGAI